MCIHIYLYVYMYTYIYVHIHTLTHTLVCMCIHTYTHTHKCVCASLSLYVCRLGGSSDRLSSRAALCLRGGGGSRVFYSCGRSPRTPESIAADHSVSQPSRRRRFFLFCFFFPPPSAPLDVTDSDRPGIYSDLWFLLSLSLWLTQGKPACLPACRRPVFSSRSAETLENKEALGEKK